jgi:hypothetical protein
MVEKAHFGDSVPGNNYALIVPLYVEDIGTHDTLCLSVDNA